MEKKQKSGFDRLRGVAAASVMSLGALAGGSARAATVTLPISSIRQTLATAGQTTVVTWMTVNDRDGINDASLYGANTGSRPVSSSSSSTADTFASDAYDGALLLDVGTNSFVNPGPTADLTSDAAGDTLTMGPHVDIIAGIDATVEYFFSETRPVVRAIYTLTNTTASDITTDVEIDSNLGSDSDTTVQATESGDTVITDVDKWFVTDDGDENWDVTITTAAFGTDASVTPTYDNIPGPGNDYIGIKYNVTVPANSTIRIMVFNDLGWVDAAASNVTKAADLESLSALNSAGLLAGLTETEIGEIVNYGGTIDSGSSSSSSGGGGSIALPGLLGGLGLLALQRRRRKKVEKAS